MVKLAIAVLSVINASAALAAPKTPVRPCGAVVLAIDACQRGAPARAQRPPRVPPREAYLHGEWRIGES